MASTSGRTRRATLAACGVAAPLVYTAAVIASSLNYPGYDHLKNFVSELGAVGAPGAAIMNYAGFLPYGVLMTAFAVALNRGIRPAVGGWLGPIVLGIYGLAYVAVAMAPCDPGCQSAAPSLHHRMHLLLGDLIILTAVLGPFTLYPRMVNDRAWRSLFAVTLVLPAASWVVLELSGVGMSGPLRQRLWLLLLFVWIELVALRLLRIGASTGEKSFPQAAA